MTTFLWRLQTRKSYLALWLTPPSCRHLLHAMLDSERMQSSSALWQRLSTSSGSNGLRLRKHLALQAGRVGHHQALHQSSSPFFPEEHDELTKSWHAPYLSQIYPSDSVALTSVDSAEDKEYEHLPPLDESVAAHLCPPTAIRWKVGASHPSKLCGATSALAGRAYSVAGQAASVLHSMAVLQVFQGKMLANEEAGLDSASLRNLRSTTDLALRATKATAQAIGHSMSSLIVLEHHLKLTKKFPSSTLWSRQAACLDQVWRALLKSSQAIRHFLPKRTSSSSASSHPRPTPT